MFKVIVIVIYYIELGSNIVLVIILIFKVIVILIYYTDFGGISNSNIIIMIFKVLVINLIVVIKRFS